MLFKKNKLLERKSTQQLGRPNPAFSYYAGDKLRKADDNVKKRHSIDKKSTTISRLRLAPSLFAIAVILLSVVYSTTLSSDVSVKFANGSNAYRTAEDYKYGVDLILGLSVWNNSKLTINARNTEAALLKAFPELDEANLILPIVGRRPTVVLHERAASMILTTPSNEYVIDTIGKIVATAKQLQSSERDKLFSVQDQSGLDLHVGSQAITANTVAFIINARAQLKDKKLDIIQITLPPVPNEVDIRIKDQRYYIKTDSSGDARLQIGGYLAVKADGVNPAEYVDVRVEEKVFYK